MAGWETGDRSTNNSDTVPDPDRTIEADERAVAANDTAVDPDETLPDSVLPVDTDATLPDCGATTDPDATLPESAAQGVGANVGSETADEDEETIVQECLAALPAETLPGATIKHVREESIAPSFELRLKPRDVLRDGGTDVSDPDYVQEKLLGEGGIGSVFSARQRSIDRMVAIKVLKRRVARRDSARNSFVSEAMITGELDHPNIVPVYDMGLDGKNPFYVMKKVQGVEWADRIAANSLTENLDILMRVADAIALAHARGIIHRDLKPANVMLGEFGEVLVMDWGLAAPTADNPKAESFPKMRFGGTPSYMAPEMAGGPIAHVDRRSDIYLLGALLFQVLTGGPPHQNATVKECLKAAADNEIAPVGEPGVLMDVALKAMATRREDRFQTVQKFQAAIEKFLTYRESFSLSKRAQAQLKRAKKSDDYDDYARVVFAFEEALQAWSGNKRAKAGLSAARLAYAKSALAKGDYDLCGSILDPDDDAHTKLRLELFEEIAESRRQAEDQQRTHQRTRHLAIGLMAATVVTVLVALIWISLSRSRAVQLANDNAQLATDAEQKRQDAEAARSDAEQNRQLAEEQSVLARSLAEASQEQLYLSQIKLADEARRKGRIRQTQELLRSTGFAHRNWEWHFLDDQSRREVALAPSPARPVAVALNDDASLIAIGLEDGRIEIRDRETDQSRAIISAHEDRITRLDFSASGERLVSAGADSAVRVWTVVTGESVFEQSIPAELYRNTPAAISDDGALVAFPAENNELTVIRIDAPDERMQLTGHEGQVSCVAFSPDNSTVATYGLDGTARFWNFQTRSQAGEVGGGRFPSLNVTEPRVDWADADTVIISKWPPVKVNLSTRRITRTIGPSWDSHFSRLQVSRDGQTLLIHGWKSGTWLYDGESGLPRFRIPSSEASVLSRSGTLVAAIQDGRTVLWDVRSTRPTATFSNSPRVAVHPTERWIAVPNGKQIDLVTYMGAVVREFRGHVTDVRNVVFSSDGSRMASETSEGEVIVWNASTGGQIRELDQTSQVTGWRHVGTVHLSSDGEYAVKASRDDVAVCNAVNGQLLRKMQRPRRVSLFPGYQVSAFHPEKPWFAVASEKTVELIDAATGEVVKELAGTFTVGATFSRDGRYLAGADGPALAVWDCESGERVYRVERHQAVITSIAFSSDGTRIATTSVDATLRLWDFASGRELLVLSPDNKAGHHVAFDPSGQFLVGSHGSGKVFVWGDPARRIHPGEQLDLLPLIDPTRDAVSGPWVKDTDGLHVSATKTPALEIPVIPSGDYRTTWKVVRDGPEESVSFYLPVDRGHARFAIDSWPSRGFLTGIHRLDGQSIEHRDDPLRGIQLTNGRSHEISITVRHADQQVNIEATLDGKPLTAWSGLSPSLAGDWALPNPGRPGVATWVSGLTVQSATLEMLSGSAVLIHEDVLDSK